MSVEARSEKADLDIFNGDKRARDEREIGDDEGARKRLKTIASMYICPITQALVVNPVMAQDGHVYEAEAISKWLNVKRSSPKTNKRMGRRLISCHVVRQSVREIVASGVLDDPVAAEWHLDIGRLQAVDKVPGGTSSALEHFRAAGALGSEEAATMERVLTEGLEVRAKLADLRQRAEEAGSSRDWIDAVLGVEQLPQPPPDDVTEPQFDIVYLASDQDRLRRHVAMHRRLTLRDAPRSHGQDDAPDATQPHLQASLRSMGIETRWEPTAESRHFWMRPWARPERSDLQAPGGAPGSG